ncbi:MAG: chemotaxis protein CheR [Pedosphaera sp.]|nr:chemotaxis protein CheR [Pedosphaera sp.]
MPKTLPDESGAAVQLDAPHPKLCADSETAELCLLLETIFERQGIDFRDYAHSSLKRRVLRRVVEEGAGSIAGLQRLALADPMRMERLVTGLTVHTTSMFRDPGFYLVLRDQVVSILRTYPFLRLWVAGCSTGEEVYSLAILLHEAGLYQRCRIYATDVNDAVLAKAKDGIFPLSVMQEYTRNYQKSGGQRDFTEYYTADSKFVVFRPFLRENVVFAAHNLAGDASFNEFHGIFCRNVMIYFNRRLQDRVHQLFHDSLVTFGYLGLGRSESVRFYPSECGYEAVSARERLYRKIK